MDLKQMFPGQYLQAEDLNPGQNTIVTIERVYPDAPRRGRRGEEPEVKWLVRLREFRKPMSLWKTTARMIAEVLESENTDAWIGQQIAIYPSTYTSFGEQKPCINVDKWRPSQVARKPAAGASLVIAHDVRPIPAAAMERFLGHAKEYNKTWDDFLRFCKTAAPEALPLAFGVDLDAIPCGILPAMKAFLDSMAAPASSPATAPNTSTLTTIRQIPAGPAAGEVVNTNTGEVERPAAQAMNFKATKAPAPAVNDDDIPF